MQVKDKQTKNIYTKASAEPPCLIHCGTETFQPVSHILNFNLKAPLSYTECNKNINLCSCHQTFKKIGWESRMIILG